MNAIFEIVYFLLMGISRLTGLTYNETNILVYYLFIPLIYFFLIDRIIKRYIFTISWIVAWGLLFVFVPNFSRFSDWAFDRSVDFLNAFAPIGWNYTAASVIICVFVPGVVFLVLFYFAFPRLFRRRLSNPIESDMQPTSK